MLDVEYISELAIAFIWNRTYAVEQLFDKNKE